MSNFHEERNKYANLILDHAEKIDGFANNSNKNRRDKAVAISSFAAIKDNIDKMKLQQWRAERLKNAPQDNPELIGKYREYYANELEEWL